MECGWGLRGETRDRREGWAVRRAGTQTTALPCPCLFLPQVKFEMSDETTLADLLQLDLHKYEDEVRNIVDKAVKESGMEKVFFFYRQQNVYCAGRRGDGPAPTDLSLPVGSVGRLTPKQSWWALPQPTHDRNLVKHFQDVSLGKGSLRPSSAPCAH